MSKGLVVGAVILGALALLYLLECLFDPYTRCPRETCTGGRIYTNDGKYWHDCRRCKGSGRRRRFGRWALDVWRAWRDR